MRKLITSLLVILVGIACFVLFLFVFQRHLIYHPRSYDSQYNLAHYTNLIPLQYQTTEGRQTSFYFYPDPHSTHIPESLWLIFGGNATLALDWYEFIARYPDDKAGFLLIEYPGYGRCEGTASPDTILASTEKAMDQLAGYLKVDRAQLENRSHILGHSLGTGAGLQYAAKHPPQQIVLVAPFTSLLDMACRTVGKPICYLLQHRFDNRARLAEIATLSPLPQVHIIHGTLDQVIPVKMGRQLANQFTQMITYREIEQADHNRIFSLAEREIYNIMQSNFTNTDQRK